jgi:hypothetical protein
VDYRSVRTRALRWIGFSEDDAKNQRPRGANIRRQSRIRVANALKTTRSTFALRWIGPERFLGRCQNQPPNAQDLLRIAREALLDIKFRRQSRICLPTR